LTFSLVRRGEPYRPWFVFVSLFLSLRPERVPNASRTRPGWTAPQGTGGDPASSGKVSNLSAADSPSITRRFRPGWRRPCGRGAANSRAAMGGVDHGLGAAGARVGVCRGRPQLPVRFAVEPKSDGCHGASSLVLDGRLLIWSRRGTNATVAFPEITSRVPWLTNRLRRLGSPPRLAVRLGRSLRPGRPVGWVIS
jgi:hypothetical protein